MKQPVIRILFVPVGGEPEVREVENKLEVSQGLVDGYIEVVGLEDGTYLVCNEEGLIIGLPLNQVVEGQYAIHGNFFICDSDDEGNFASLDDGAVERYTELFGRGE